MKAVMLAAGVTSKAGLKTLTFGAVRS